MILLYCETCGLRIAEAEIAELRARKISEFGWVCAGCAGKQAAQPVAATEPPAAATATVEMKLDLPAPQRSRTVVTRSAGAKGKASTEKTKERPAWLAAVAGAGVVLVLAGLVALTRNSLKDGTVKDGSAVESVAVAPVVENVKLEAKQSAPQVVQPGAPAPMSAAERMREAEKGIESIRDARASSLLKEHQAWFEKNGTNLFEYAERLRDLAGTYRSSPAAREAEKIAAELKFPEAKGRFVRIELLGSKRILSLAEVQVYSNGSNVALKGKATQASVSSNGHPARAIDGGTTGIFNSGSTTHTNEQENPWWEVELPGETAIQFIVIWNRTDCCQDRLKDFKVSVLGSDRQTVWTKTVNGIPPAKSVLGMQ